MENQSLLLTLGVGVLASFILFFMFYKVLRWSGKLAALLTILIVEAVYIPLAATHWAGLDVFAIHFAFFTMTAAGLGIIASNKANADPTKTGRKGIHWVPATIIGFFLILAAVDSVILTLANKGASASFVKTFLPEPQRQSAQNVASAFPGTVSNDFQKQYAQYNNYLKQLQTQSDRGWQVKGGWSTKPFLGKPTDFSIQVLDKTGQPITGASVNVAFMRPANKAMDVDMDLQEISPGTYALPINLAAPGRWDMVLLVSRGEDMHEVKGETWIEATP